MMHRIASHPRPQSDEGGPARLGTMRRDIFTASSAAKKLPASGATKPATATRKPPSTSYYSNVWRDQTRGI